MNLKLVLILFLAIVLLAFAIGYLSSLPPEWTDYPQNIIIDTHEEFQSKNTP